MIIIDENILRTKCDDVSLDEINSIIDKLQIELDYANKLGKSGVGLAAPQIGIFKKAAIIRYNKFSLNLINCKIEKTFDPFIFKEESCLSFPSLKENTNRYEEIYVKDNLIYPYSFIATGQLSVIIQHEIDHLNGILFFDKKIKS
jgi:peptide deformylase